MLPKMDDDCAIVVVVAASAAPSLGARVSIDYLNRSDWVSGVRHLTWLVEDPGGAWVVWHIERSPDGRAFVNLVHPVRFAALQARLME